MASRTERKSLRLAELEHTITTDLEIPGRGVNVLSEQGPPTYNFIRSLWNAPENKEVVEKFLNNRLCRECAENKDPDACRKFFRTYAIQDYFYLVDYIKFKALRLTTIPQGDFKTLAAEAKSIGSSPNYVADWLANCKEMNISDDRIESEERSVAELAYANWLQINASRGDWFNAHVIMIGCAYGWSKLARELFDKDSTRPDTEFYEHWIIPSIEAKDPRTNPEGFSKSAQKLSAFLDGNVGIWRGQTDKEKWNSLFRTSLRLEVALFDSAYSPYGDISQKL